MANPQAENGHVDIANEIVDSLAKIRLSGEEVQCLWVIFRKTYGWKKAEDMISLSQFSEKTGLSKQHVHRALLKLSSKKVISITQNGYKRPNTIRFIKDFETWIISPKKGIYPKKGTDIPNIGKTIYPKMVNTKDTNTKDNNIYKHTYGEFKNVLLTEEEKQKVKDEEIENLSSYIASKGAKYKSHYATIIMWRRKNYGANSGKRGEPYRESKGKSTKYAGLETVCNIDSTEG